MPESIKEQIKSDLEKAKTQGQLRSGNIRQIVSQAIFQAVGEIKEGSGELGSIAKETINTVAETFKEKGQEVKEEIQASIEGLVDGISRARQEAIAKDREQIQQLQTRIDEQERQLQSSVDGALIEIEVANQEANSETRSSIKSAIEALKDTEEAALMRKRYAQLQAELSILQANLAARYGEQYEEVKKHLDTAQVWYKNAQAKSENTGKTLVEQKQTDFEAKLSEAGAALARKEKELKRILQDLWRSMSKSDKP
ncbi:histidine kinase [Merismopedia glauca]|uniref:Histidine kinase n=1 Tax=Merismopedia glauca CCAP 1448/3 TaxID=1296344 RepID=A0A2T1BXL5_9CYAN|nr:histidine kinase [Merismopedia glauca]PSB00755.1 histidine kinase [Merismopedia glauca CCAP 1448/3]